MLFDLIMLGLHLIVIRLIFTQTQHDSWPLLYLSQIYFIIKVKILNLYVKNDVLIFDLSLKHAKRNIIFITLVIKIQFLNRGFGILIETLLLESMNVV